MSLHLYIYTYSHIQTHALCTVSYQNYIYEYCQGLRGRPPHPQEGGAPYVQRANTDQLHTTCRSIYKIGAHRTDPTRIKGAQNKGP